MVDVAFNNILTTTTTEQLWFNPSLSFSLSLTFRSISFSLTHPFLIYISLIFSRFVPPYLLLFCLLTNNYLFPCLPFPCFTYFAMNIVTVIIYSNKITFYLRKYRSYSRICTSKHSLHCIIFESILLKRSFLECR